MRLSRKFDYALISLAIFSIGLAFFTTFSGHHLKTYADNEESGIYEEKGTYFVTIFDESKKLTVKTASKTVAEVLAKLGITINQTDSVEPGLGTVINSDHFFINIYRSHPAIVKDGSKEKYIMTSSYNPKTIMEEAGITVYDGDDINLIPNSKFLETGIANAYEIVRNGSHIITVEEEIDFNEQTIKDYSMDYGTSEVRRLGEVGRKTVTIEVKYKDNVEISREIISEEIIKEPVDRVVANGARSRSTTSATENESIIWDYLLAQGFSKVQTAGIMGNLQQEHHFDTSDTSGGLGIAQWTGGRRTNLISRGDYLNIHVQLQYLMDELNGGYAYVKNAILNATTIEDATIIFQNKFERCGVCREDQRINYAYEIYERHQ